jgi:hypothetical protein
MVPFARMSKQNVPDILQRFKDAIKEEIQATRDAQREYSIVQGKRLAKEGSRILYQFSSRKPLTAKDDSECVLNVRGQKTKGQFVSGGQRIVTISVAEELGDFIPSAKLAIDETQLLKSLLSAFDDLTHSEKESSWNQGLADRSIGLEKNKVPPPLCLAEMPSGLTPDQGNAIATVFKSETTFLWGPPGTGKTFTLGAMAHALYQAGQRVLVVAHTNQAVDGVLESFCKRVTQDGAAPLEEEQILRLGPIVRESLREKWGSSLSFDEVLRRKEQVVHDEIKLHTVRSLEIGAELEKLKDTQEQWNKRESVRAEIKRLNSQMSGYRTAVRRLIGSLTGTHDQLSRQLERDFQELSRQRELEKRLDEILKGENPRLWEEKTASLRENREELNKKISLLQERVVTFKASLFANAQVIATSTTQAFLRARNLSDFDVILIDEASMVPLPIAYYLSGIPNARVVIAGDFRQLPPIARSDAEVVKEWYARDLFFAAGIVDDVNAQRHRANLAKLTSQFRSHSDLCEIINKRFYGGDLTSHYTERAKLIFTPSVEYLRDNRIVLIDTSELDGAGQFVESSKSNLMHALLIRRLCVDLANMSDDPSNSSVGVIAPYRPQVDLIQGLLAEQELSGIAVGTVHRFQGDERAVMMLDLTESNPHKLGGFFKATSIDEQGARLLNVALSRAQRNLIVVANLKYFREQLSSGHVLTGILEDLQVRGHVVRGESIMSPEKPEVESPASAGSAPYYPRTQYFNAEEFAAAFRADVKEAHREVVIVSAFVSANRVNAIRDTLTERKRAGVSITVIVPPQRENGSIDPASYEDALSILKKIGVRVITKSRIHAKAVCIDREVVWTGSLNPLSYSGSNKEIMVRDLSPVAYASALEQFKDDLGSFTSAVRQYVTGHR